MKKQRFTLISILLFLLFVVIFFHRFLIEHGVPGAFKYVLDLFNILMFAIALTKRKFGKILFKYMFLCYALILIWGTVLFAVNRSQWGTSILSYVFDCRLLLRFPIFIYSCSVLVKREDLERLFDLCLAFHCVNCVYIVYQYFTLEVFAYWMRGDNLNGFFGVQSGGNVYVNVLMLVVTLVVIDRFLKGKYSMIKLCSFIILNVMISVLIELKIYFVELLIISLVFAIPYIKKPTLSFVRKVCIVVLIAIPAFIGFRQLLYMLYPSMAGTLSISALIKVASSSDGYTGEGDINRLTAIPDVVRLIYNGDWLKSLVGVGLGIANTTYEDALFVSKYSMTHYSWMSTSYSYIEVGIFGFVTYAFSFLLPMFYSNKKHDYCWMVRVASLLAVFLLVYNESMKTEAGYIISLVLAANVIGSEPNESEGSL